MRWVHVVLALLLAGCAPSCPSGLVGGASLDLYFGRDGVSDADWRDFVERSIVPRFPDGMSIFDAAGTWRDPRTGRAVSEDSKVLRVVASDARAFTRPAGDVIEDYKKRFAQQSVLRVEQAVCHAF